MQVSRLIEMLRKCPQDAEVVFFVDWYRQMTINDVSPEDADHNVVLGCDLPPEVYARDYRDD